MKKLLIISLALVTITSCSKEQTIEQPDPVSIGFDNIHVDNSTRANDLTADNIEDFGVYGFVEALSSNTEGLLFENVKVKKEGSDFKYSPVQYWIGNAQYYFAAMAPYTNANWSYTSTDAQNGTVKFMNNEAGANQDLLFAYTKPEVTNESITTKPAKVGFTFSHMLSRVKFSFTNGFETGSNISLKITGVTITDAQKEGTLSISNGNAGDWSVADNAEEKNVFSINFGDAVGDIDNLLDPQENASTEHFYMIPTTDTYNATFTVALYQAGVLVDTYNRSATIPVKMLKGFSYNIKATLNASNTSDDGELFPIEFTVIGVNEWDTTDPNVNATVSNQGFNN